MLPLPTPTPALCPAERRIREERDRCLELLHASTTRKLMDVVHAQLIAAHAVALIEVRQRRQRVQRLHDASACGRG